MYTLLAALLIVAAQDSKPPEFEVASIKPSSPDARGTYIRTSAGGRVNVTNFTLKELIVFAYRVQPFQITGGPAWLATAHWDVSAKPENSPKQGELPLMLQSLLADRFQLTLHRETKELPIYALVLARKDGKLGPNFTESKEGGCTVPDRNNPPPPAAPGKPQTVFCGQQMMGRGTLRASSIPLENLVPMLARLMGRTVIDKTGLKGKFDIGMEWTPDEGQFGPPPPDTPKPSDVSGPTIFTALQEQLGLKLESQKGPVEILVVERAEKPSEN